MEWDENAICSKIDIKNVIQKCLLGRYCRICIGRCICVLISTVDICSFHLCCYMARISYLLNDGVALCVR